MLSPLVEILSVVSLNAGSFQIAFTALERAAQYV